MFKVEERMEGCWKSGGGGGIAIEAGKRESGEERKLRVQRGSDLNEVERL